MVRRTLPAAVARYSLARYSTERASPHGVTTDILHNAVAGSLDPTSTAEELKVCWLLIYLDRVLFTALTFHASSKKKKL